MVAPRMTLSDSSAHLRRVGEISMPSWSITQSAPRLGDLLDRHADQLLGGDRRGSLRDRAALAVEAQVGDLPSSTTMCTPSSSPQSGLWSWNSRSCGSSSRSSAGSCSGRGCSRGRGRPASEPEDLARAVQRVHQRGPRPRASCRRGTRPARWRPRRAGASAAGRSGGRRGRRRPRGRTARRCRADASRRSRTGPRRRGGPGRAGRRA